MGYYTGFSGEFGLDKPLTVEQKKILDDFSEERHGGDMQHDPSKPGFWCDWAPNEDGTAIEWNGSEKFYDYVGWIEYLVEHFIKPWGLTMNGEVEWEGEESGDLGKIVVKDNVVTTQEGTVVYG